MEKLTQQKISTMEYQEQIMRTCGVASYEERLAMGAMGLAGEVGECCDLLKKHLWHGHEIDKDKATIEIGDVFWYLGLLCNTLNLSFEDIMQRNLDKLRKRYPAGFSAEASKNRTE